MDLVDRIGPRRMLQTRVNLRLAANLPVTDLHINPGRALLLCTSMHHSVRNRLASCLPFCIGQGNISIPSSTMVGQLDLSPPGFQNPRGT